MARFILFDVVSFECHRINSIYELSEDAELYTEHSSSVFYAKRRTIQRNCKIYYVLYCLGSLWLVFTSFSLALFLLHTDIRKFSMLALEFKGLMQCVGYVKCTFFSFNCTKYSIVWNCHLVRLFIRIASSRFVDSRDLEAAIRHLRQLY